jgi:hypothetical protein
MTEVIYRWLNGPDATDADWDKIESVLASRGWMSLNRNTSRILVAERDGMMAFLVFQWLPYCGPLFVPPSMLGSGVAKELATQMMTALIEGQARGWVATAESPHAAKLCEELGMDLLKTPLYLMSNPGGIDL